MLEKISEFFLLKILFFYPRFAGAQRVLVPDVRALLADAATRHHQPAAVAARGGGAGPHHGSVWGLLRGVGHLWVGVGMCG